MAGVWIEFWEDLDSSSSFRWIQFDDDDVLDFWETSLLEVYALSLLMMLLFGGKKIVEEVTRA